MAGKVSRKGFLSHSFDERRGTKVMATRNLLSRSVVEWLLEGPGWIEYRTRLDLLGQSRDDDAAQAARDRMLADAQVQGLLTELSDWPWEVIRNHKSAGHPLHKLSFIAELGLTVEVPQVKRIASRILDHQSPEGPFQVLMNIPAHFGGTGKDQWAWALCDSPLLLHALGKFGLSADRRVEAAAKYLAGLAGEIRSQNQELRNPHTDFIIPNSSFLLQDGWGCEHGPELGKFRGPGRKDDPCPYANLIMLKALAELPEYRDGDACRRGAETALTLWAERRTRHPYMFYAGTDFCKLKAPLVWYDIVHLLDVLSRFRWLSKDPRLREIASVVRARVGRDGRVTPESVWQAWGDWEFGQKKAPSRWLTLLVQRALKRLDAQTSSGKKPLMDADKRNQKSEL
jgi:hypothetical protein